MSYYWFNREKLLKNVWDKWKNKKLLSTIEKMPI